MEAGSPGISCSMRKTTTEVRKTVGIATSTRYRTYRSISPLAFEPRRREGHEDGKEKIFCRSYAVREKNLGGAGFILPVACRMKPAPPRNPAPTAYVLS